MSELKAYIAKVATGKPLSFDEARAAFGGDHVRRGDAEPDRRVPDGHARQGRDGGRDCRARCIDAREDGAGRSAAGCDRHRRHGRRRRAETFNISTATSIVVAAAAYRSPSTATAPCPRNPAPRTCCRRLGIKIDIGPDKISQCIREAGIGFMFAPAHHPAMKHVGPTRDGDGHAHHVQPARAAI